MTTATTHTERIVSVRDGAFEIEVREGGDGPPLLYLHNMMAEYGWFPFMERLSEHYRVIAPIFPGFRESTGLQHIDDPVDTVVYHNDLLDALGLDSVVLMGHELGGMFAAELAALSPHRVEKLVLIDAYGLWMEEHPVPDYFATPRRTLPSLMWHDHEVRGRPGVQPSDARPGDLDPPHAGRRPRAGRFLWQFPDRGLNKRIHRIQSPTLVVWGESDGQIPPEYGPAFNALIPGSQLVTIAEAGNLPQLEQVDAFMDAVLPFLG